MRSTTGVPKTRFAREKYFPNGWESLLAQFIELFHPYDYIYKPVSGGSWSSANEKWKLTSTEIIKAISCANEAFYIGTRSGKKTRYAVLDIDATSKYHSKPQLDRLLQVLSKAGLERSSLFRSSFSGGWHLYLFFDEHVNSALVYRQLVSLLKLSDFEVSKGTLEVFPHPGTASKGMGLRLPLQHGWAWLNKRDLEVEHERYEMTATKALEWFIDLLDSDANPIRAFNQLTARIEELEKRKSAARAHGINEKPDNVVPIRKADRAPVESEFASFVTSIFGHVPAGMNAENWNKGRVFHKEGLTGPSQRAESIFCLGHYFFYGDPSRNLPALGYGCEEERNWAIKEYLDARHNGYSTDINRGRADATAQVDRATNWRPAHKRSVEPKKYSAVRPVSWVRENANRKSDARKRIQEALSGIKKLQRTFTTVELQEAARCSRRTLYAHQDLWRSDYEDLASGCFAICTDEYNAVVGAAFSESLPPSAVAQKIAPPGLLAARRIVYELSMRDKREEREKKTKRRDGFVQLDNSWRLEIEKILPLVLGQCDTKKLRALLAVYLSAISRSPDAESESWIRGLITEVRVELDRRPKQIELVFSNSQNLVDQQLGAHLEDAGRG